MREKVIGQHLASRLWFGAALAVAVISVAGCDGDGEPSGTLKASPSPETATAEPSATLSLEDEIGQAYLRYWDAYSDALLELDVSLVEDVATGEQLERVRAEIEGFRAQGLALRVRVEHDFVVVEASEDSATVTDTIVNNSFFVDAVTKEPPEGTSSGEILEDTYRLEKIGGQWMVTSGSRQR